MQVDFLAIVNLIGVIAFAFSGAMKAIREQLDLLGILVLGIITALGGGIIRDLLINRIPYVFFAFVDVAVAVLGVAAACLIFRLLRKDLSNRYYIVIPDAFGLAAFTLTGALVAYHAGVTGFGQIILASVTAVGGGVIGDLLLGKVPSVLKDDCYATCAIAGGSCFYITLHLGADLSHSSMLCGGLTLLFRMLAIQCRWSLPKFKHSEDSM